MTENTPKHVQSREISAWSVTVPLAIGASLGWTIWGLRAASVVAPVAVPWLVLLGVFALAEILLVHFDFRGETQALTLGEVPLLVGLVFCSPAGLLVARLGASLLVLGLHVRQPRVKLAFNLAMHATKVLAALAVYVAALGSASPVSARGWAAAFLAAATADLVSHLLIILVITITAGAPSRASLLPMALTCAVAAVTNTSLALLAVVIVWYDPAATWLLVVVAGVYAAGYRAHTAIRRRYANLKQLYRFTRALSGAVIESDVIEAVLRESRELLGAERAELAVVTGSAIQRYTLLEDEDVRSELVARPSPLEALVIASGASSLAPRHPRDEHVQLLLDGCGHRDLIAAPVTSGTAVTAVLTVANRASSVTTFDEDDCRLFETLANHAAVALQGGQLLERLHDEVAAKEHQALHDHLTGLANRTLFATRVTESLERGVGRTAVLLMDLDRFKEINDTLGHHTGDVVLMKIAGRLVLAVGALGTVARLGGDEFAVVCHHVDSDASAVAFARELLLVAESAINVDGMVLEVQASVGIALAPEHGDDASTLLQRADVAMYDAKHDHHGVSVYKADNDHYTPRRLSLVGELRAALTDNALELYYQPQVTIADRRVCGAEALLRWNHPRYGFIAPDEFIPIAEHSGLMVPLTTWVMDTALRQARRWTDDGLDLVIAVNISARSMADPSLVDEIQALLTKNGVAGDRLVLELTETSIMPDVAGGMDMLHRLAATGAHLSIDDFGTGYSSLSRLARLPVDEVKIDRSFTIGMGRDASSAVIVRSTIDLARNLGLRVVAEGVEDLATWNALAELKCDVAQGYLLTRALPAPEFAEWLTSWQASPAQIMEVPRLKIVRSPAARRSSLGPY